MDNRRSRHLTLRELLPCFPDKFAVRNTSGGLMFPKVPAMICSMNSRTPSEVGAMVKARRLELGMTPGDLIAAAHIDIKTLTRLEDGSRVPQARTRLKLDPALKWKPGGIDRLLAGQDPEVENQLADHIRQSRDGEPAPDEGRMLFVIQRLLDRGDFPEEDRAQLQYELENMQIERFPKLYESLSREGKLLVTRYGQRVQADEQKERGNAVETTPQSDASTEGDEDEEAVRSPDDAQSAAAVADAALTAGVAELEINSVDDDGEQAN